MISKSVSQFQTLPGGLIVKESKSGEGKPASKGKKVSLRYVGKLDNGKVFDSNTSGKPFSFKVGGGQVIKGMDSGIEGISRFLLLSVFCVDQLKKKKNFLLLVRHEGWWRAHPHHSGCPGLWSQRCSSGHPQERALDL